MAVLERRTPAQRSRRAEIEAAVLGATEALLETGISYADLSVERIATEAGISRTAFYFYFRDKRELLLRLTDDVIELLYEQADRWWSGDGDGAVELERALRNVVTLYRDHASLLRAVVEASAYDEQVAVFWRALVDRFVAATRRRLDDEQETGRVAAETASGEIAFALCWMTERACYQRLVEGGDPTDETFFSGVAQIWLRSVYGRLP